MSILVVEGLGKSFGGVQAVSDVSFTVTPGEMLALIGPNGAGKSTVFNVVSRFYRPTSGSVSYGGQDLLAPRPLLLHRLRHAREGGLFGHRRRSSRRYADPIRSSQRANILQMFLGLILIGWASSTVFPSVRPIVFNHWLTTPVDQVFYGSALRLQCRDHLERRVST